jgi:hypothetical protein
MKLSQVSINELKQYANVYHNLDDNLFTAILVAGRTFISSYTGLPLTTTDGTDNCDNYEDLTIALYCLSAEMYDNRAMIVDNDKLNFVIKTILDSHSVNLV